MRHAKFPPLLIGSIAAAWLALGCQLSQPHTALPAAFASVAQISAISPDPGRVLHRGERVKLELDVSYMLSAESAAIELVVLAEDNSDVAHDRKAITKGSGKATLRAEFTVPATTVVRVFTPIIVPGENATSAADGREFKVIAD